MKFLHLLILFLLLTFNTSIAQEIGCENASFRFDNPPTLGSCNDAEDQSLCNVREVIKRLEDKKYGKYNIVPSKESVHSISVDLEVNEHGKVTYVKAKSENFPFKYLEYLEYDMKAIGEWTPANLHEKDLCVFYDLQLGFAEESVSKVEEYMPRFPGCEHIENPKDREDCAKQLMLEFVYKNLVYPLEARKDKIEGMPVVQFVVSKTGELEDVKVVKSLTPECDQAAMDVIKKMPTWIPGTQKGKEVKVLYTLPIRFKLQI